MVFDAHQRNYRYSGVAWATAADFEIEQISHITSWPGNGRDEGKTPTELDFEDGELTWGYEIGEDADPARWFKLLLLRDEDLDADHRHSEFLVRARRMLRETGKTATDLVADYLQALWKYVLEVIYRAVSQSVIEEFSFHIVITVPAIWKGYARKRMEDAVKQSGILKSRQAGPTTLALAPEPEAAALASLYESKLNLRGGDVFIVVDAGGGTVVSWRKSISGRLHSWQLMVEHNRILLVIKLETLTRLPCTKR